MVAIRPLPRSLEPLPGEALSGYLLRLAHRLGLPPVRVSVLTGLIDARLRTVPACRLFALDPDHAEAFARATRLSTAEVTALTLVSLADRYPPLDPAFSGRNRQPHGIFVKENWVFSRATRYCPDCLAGNNSAIQQRHGGAWKLHWRLPIVFACPVHRRLLRHTCPACQHPAHDRAAGDGQMLPLAVHGDLHPAQCRNPIADPGTRYGVRACGARLDRSPEPDSGTAVREDQVRFQQDLLSLLHADPGETISSAGAPAGPSRYLVDLRLISCLITSSWPAARSLVDHPAQARLLDEHVQRTRNQVAAIRRAGRTAREIAFYDKPPLDSATCGHLLRLADRITSAGDTDTVRALLRPLLAQAPPGMPIWTRQFLTGQGYCSPGLQTAVGPEVGSRHVIKAMGIQPQLQSPPPRPVRFGVHHIPQHLLPEWHADYISGFTEVKPHLLRRATAARLAQMCVGGPTARAAELLGIPHDAGFNALSVVKQHLRGRSNRLFEAAVHSLADHLNNSSGLVDYGKRRDALKAWSIPLEEWHTLIAGLPERPVSGVVRTYIDWGENKRILASMWVWVRVTGGEHIFAPAIRPDLDQPRPGGHVIQQIHNRWPLINNARPTGHYIALRERLEVYADRLTAAIDCR